MFQSCSRFKMAELGAAPAGMFEARLEHCGVLRRVVEGVRETHSTLDSPNFHYQEYFHHSCR